MPKIHSRKHYNVNRKIKRSTKTRKAGSALMPLTKLTELCDVKGSNTFEGSIFKKKDVEGERVFREYSKYKKQLNDVVKDSNIIKEHRRDDYYTYINVDWLAKQEKKLQKELKYYSQVDNFRIVQEKVYYEMIDLVKKHIKENPSSKKAKLLSNVYNSFYNTTKQIGLQHTHRIKDDVERFINAKDMYGLLAYTNSNEVYSWASPIVWSVLPDEKNVDKYISHLSPPQLGAYDYFIYIDLPTDNAETKAFKREFKQKYLKFIEDTFKIALPNNYREFNAEDVWNVEVQMLDAMGCDSFTEDPNYYNVVTKHDLESSKFDFDWTQFSKKIGYKTPPQKVVVSSLNSLKCVTSLLKEKWDTPEWKTYWLFIFYKTMLRFEWDWNQTYYDFYAKFVQGQPVRFPRELYPIFMMSFTFNSLLTELYVGHAENPIYVNYVKNMVEDLRRIFINKIKRNTWLSPSTKKMAIKKLVKLKLVVGRPEELREDPLLPYCDNDPWYNIDLLAKWRHQKFIDYEGQTTAVDVPEIDWNELKLTGTQAYVVNAYYRPTSNSIYVPLAYLQKPFIDLDERGIEYNLAHVGYTMGHELSHCLDDMGSKFDEKGNLHNWWTPHDKKIFNSKIADVVKQYEMVAKRDGIKFDAKIGTGENLADISGLSLVEEYLLMFQEANEDIDIIKKISLEAFYVYSAIQSRQKMYEKAIPAQLKTNPHPLEKYRCNCPLMRLELFRTIYNVKQGDGMWWHNTDTIW
jgi:predicted metalloendopeptidase